MCSQPKVLRSLSCHKQLIDSPLLSGLRVTANFGGRKPIECVIISWMNSHELALQVRGEFSDFQSMRSRNPGDFITVGLGSCCFFQIEETLVPTRHLNSFIAETGNPLTDAVKAVEWCLIARKLG